MKKVAMIIACYLIILLCISHIDKKVSEIYGFETPDTISEIFSFKIR